MYCLILSIPCKVGITISVFQMNKIRPHCYRWRNTFFVIVPRSKDLINELLKTIFKFPTWMFVESLDILLSFFLSRRPASSTLAWKIYLLCLRKLLNYGIRNDTFY